MMWSIVIITGLVVREVATHRVSAGVANMHMKEVAIIRKLILHMCCKNRYLKMCDQLAWQLFIPTQPIPTVPSARLH